MWGSKRPEAPQAAKPEPRNLQTNQALMPPPAALEGTAQKSKEVVRPSGLTTDGLVARLGPSLQVKGEVSGSEDLLIDGSVEGSIQLEEKKLTIGATAKVTAEIVAGEVVVIGSAKGNVRAKQRIEIKRNASVIGDLTTAQIVIEDGACFIGAVEIDKDAEKPAGTTFHRRPLNAE